MKDPVQIIPRAHHIANKPENKIQLALLTILWKDDKLSPEIRGVVNETINFIMECEVTYVPESQRYSFHCDDNKVLLETAFRVFNKEATILNKILDHLFESRVWYYPKDKLLKAGDYIALLLEMVEESETKHEVVNLSELQSGEVLDVLVDDKIVKIEKDLNGNLILRTQADYMVSTRIVDRPLVSKLKK